MFEGSVYLIYFKVSVLSSAGHTHEFRNVCSMNRWMKCGVGEEPLTVRSGLGFGNAPHQNGACRAVRPDVFLEAVWIGTGGAAGAFPAQQLYHLFQQGASGETLTSGTVLKMTHVEAAFVT